jgi:5-methylcytosine-specific restriction protein A
VPTAPLTYCTEPGCGEKVQRGKCAAHTKAADQRRGTAHSRGYDRVWQAFRAWFIARHPLCEDCKEQGLIEPTAEVHHIRKVKEHPELRLVESNCRGLCKACHSKRTLRGE